MRAPILPVVLSLTACTTVRTPTIIAPPEPQGLRVFTAPQPPATVPGQKHLDFDGQRCWTEDGAEANCPAGILLNEQAFKQAIIDRAAANRLVSEGGALAAAANAGIEYRDRVRSWAANELPKQMATAETFWDRHGDKVSFVAGIVLTVLVLRVGQ